MSLVHSIPGIRLHLAVLTFKGLIYSMPLKESLSSRDIRPAAEMKDTKAPLLHLGLLKLSSRSSRGIDILTYLVATFFKKTSLPIRLIYLA